MQMNFLYFPMAPTLRGFNRRHVVICKDPCIRALGISLALSANPTRSGQASDVTYCVVAVELLLPPRREDSAVHLCGIDITYIMISNIVVFTTRNCYDDNTCTSL